MNITADTNLLVRAAVDEDDPQTAPAKAELAAAHLVAIPLPALCEMVWVMSQGYKRSSDRIAESIRGLSGSKPEIDGRLRLR